jgi:hypothetical protein
MTEPKEQARPGVPADAVRVSHRGGDRRPASGMPKRRAPTCARHSNISGLPVDMLTPEEIADLREDARRTHEYAYKGVRASAVEAEGRLMRVQRSTAKDTTQAILVATVALCVAFLLLLVWAPQGWWHLASDN